MARKRVLDIEDLCFDTEMVELLKERGTILYEGLWGHAEDWGGYDPKYADIAFRMGAFKFKPLEVEKYIAKLIQAKKIIPYEVNGIVYHWIKNLLKRQPLDNPAPPKLPLPIWITCEILQYKSGKKYAKYSVNAEKLPVGYQSATRNSETVTETKRNSKETVTETKQSSNLYVDFEKSTLTLWNSFCEKYPTLSKVEALSETRRTHLKQRFEKENFRDFEKILSAIEEQPFLIHGNSNSDKHKNWHINFDWIVANDTNYLKIIEGFYKDKASNKSTLIFKKE